MTIARERRPLEVNLDIANSNILPTTASAVGIDLNTGKQIYFNTSSLSWQNQTQFVGSASYASFTSLTAGPGISIGSNQAISASLLAGTNVTINQVGNSYAISSSALTSSVSGPAGGDLSGSYPNPSVVKMTVSSSTAIPFSITGSTVAMIHPSGMFTLGTATSQSDLGAPYIIVPNNAGYATLDNTGSPALMVSLDSSNTASYGDNNYTLLLKSKNLRMNLTPSSDAQGDTYYRGSDGFVKRLPAGNAGEVLTTNGAAANPSWTGGMVTTSSHKALTDLIHYIDGGPVYGPGPYYYVQTPLGSLSPTTGAWYTNVASNKKVVEQNIVWNGAYMSQSIWKVYASDGVTVVGQITDNFTYISGSLAYTTRSINV